MSAVIWSEHIGLNAFSDVWTISLHLTCVLRQIEISFFLASGQNLLYSVQTSLESR